MSDKTYNLRFNAVETAAKSFNEPTLEDLSATEFLFNFLIEIKLSAEKKAAIAITTTSIMTKEDSKELAKFKIVCGFEIENFDESVVKINDNLYDIPFELEVLLKSVSFSTCRGVIASEVKGTYLQKAILPLIDIAALIKEQKEKSNP
jgi:hypothetical protein